MLVYSMNCFWWSAPAASFIPISIW